jgi:hypothetical protein
MDEVQSFFPTNDPSSSTANLTCTRFVQDKRDDRLGYLWTCVEAFLTDIGRMENKSTVTKPTSTSFLLAQNEPKEKAKQLVYALAERSQAGGISVFVSVRTAGKGDHRREVSEAWCSLSLFALS